jgi:gas vesicle protein
MDIMIGVAAGLVVGIIVGLILGVKSGKKSTVAKVKQILKQEKVDINIDQALNKKNAGTVKEDFFEIQS